MATRKTTATRTRTRPAGRSAHQRTPRIVDESRDGDLVQISERYALPQRFSATIEPADSDSPLCRIAVVVEDNRPVVEGVTLVRRPNGPPITSTMLRHVPVAEYARRAADQCGRWVLPGPGPVTVEMKTADGETVTSSIPFEAFGEGHVAIPLVGLGQTGDYGAAARPPRERGLVSEETLREAAAIYNEADEAKTKAVREKMRVSPSTASRYVRRAKDAGLIPTD